MLRFGKIPGLSVAVLSLSLILISGCDKDDDDDEKIEYNITATADGDQEVPAVTTDGTGTVAGTYNKNTNLFTFTCTWEGLTGPATNMHFHGPADAGVSAGVAIPIEGFTSAVEGSVSGTATLNETQEGELLGGKWYFNVHTEMHPAGEIRGQVTAN